MWEMNVRAHVHLGQRLGSDSQFHRISLLLVSVPRSIICTKKEYKCIFHRIDTMADRKLNARVCGLPMFGMSI